MHTLKRTFLPLFLLTALLFYGCQSKPPKIIQSTLPVAPSEVQSHELILRPYVGPKLPALRVQDVASELLKSKLGPHTGVFLCDLDKGQEVLAIAENEGHLPSSVSKLFTAYAGLEILGSKFTFKTQVFHSGKIKRGVLYGDLYLIGQGDPYLTMSDLMSLAQALRAHGIARIQGQFFYDESEFEPQEYLDPASDLAETFNPGLSALSLEFNQMNTQLLPGSHPQELFYTLIPPLPFLSSFPETEDFLKVGKRRLPVHDPGRFTALAFRQLAAFLSVDLPEPEAKKMPKKTQLLVTHHSLPLVQLVEKNLEYSNNLISELILQKAGQNLSQKKLTHPQSAQKIETWLRKKMKLSPAFRLQNGSGLGPYNRHSARDLVAVLKKMQAKTYSGRTLATLLPISGLKGTLSERYDSPLLAGRVWAKTGTQSFSHTLAGLFFAPTGKRYLFALMFTHWPGRRLYDEQDKKDDSLKESAQMWNKEWRQFSEAFLTSLSRLE